MCYLCNTDISQSVSVIIWFMFICLFLSFCMVILIWYDCCGMFVWSFWFDVTVVVYLSQWPGFFHSCSLTHDLVIWIVLSIPRNKPFSHYCITPKECVLIYYLKLCCYLFENTKTKMVFSPKGNVMTDLLDI
jgi:hypothetical protein